MNIEEGVKKYEKPLLVLCISCFLALIFTLVMLFMSSYERLQDSLSAERTVYITELSEQLVDKVNHTQETYFRETRFYARLLEDSQPDSFSEAEKLLSLGLQRASVQSFLIDKEGNVYTSKGKSYTYGASEFLFQLVYERKEATSFIRSSKGEENWVFGCPVESLTIEGVEIKALLITHAASDFNTSFALDLFDQEGAAAIINKQGAIVVGAHTARAYGYNLFSSLLESGMDEEICLEIKARMQAGESGQMYVGIGKETWLLQFEQLHNEEQYIVVLVPISVTAAMPFRYMNRTLMMGLLSIMTFALFFFLVLFLAAKSNRRKNEILYQAELVARTAQAKSDFMSRMSHDIRTPLNAIIGMNYIAGEHLDNKELLKDNLKKMNASANYLLELINDMLDMQKIESGKMTLNPAEFSLKDLIEGHENLLHMSMERKGLAFEIQGEEYLRYHYIGDKLRIGQILMNLLSNAVKFTDEGGKIALLIQVEKQKEDKDLVTFIIEDTGIGISREYMQNIFKPFEQEGSIAAKYGGSGLGLSIVYNLVTLMNGTIDVKSEQGNGTRFMVTLPLQRTGENKGKQYDKKKESKHSLKGYRVLVAEDNEINMEIARTVLEMQGLIVEEEENGKAALSRFEVSPPGYYAAVITDVKMPVMDGHQLARAIRSGNHPDAATIPILAMSANSFEEDIQAALEAGMTAHLRKPMTIEELEIVLQKYIGEQEEDREE